MRSITIKIEDSQEFEIKVEDDDFPTHLKTLPKLPHHFNKNPKNSQPRFTK